MKIDETNLHADRFEKDASAILLSHYHSDHLTGIRRRGNTTPVLCSAMTGRLLVEMEEVAPERVRAIEAGETVTVQDGAREIRVTAFDANHCPGSLMFLVEWDGKRVFYTGDFRLNDALRKTAKACAGVDVLYLDDTYDDPRYRFPLQADAVEEVLGLMRERGEREVLIAVYSIGKNRIIEAAHREFGLPFYTTDDKRRVYETIGMGHMVTGDREATPFRAYGRGYLEKYFRMTAEFRAGKHLVIIPTGWALDRRSSRTYRYVAYSEHCDHAELTEFKKLMRAKQVTSIHARG